MGGPLTMIHKFQCKHCGSRFSLAQELEAHEGPCGAAGADHRRPEEKKKGSSQIIKCKHCSEIFENFGEYGRHRWAAHREQELAAQAEARRQRKTDEAKIDAGLASRGNGKSTRAAEIRPGPGPAEPAATGPTCPTCGGILPEATSQLIRELAAAGIPEAQAFEAARIARRIFGAGSEKY
jgi:hypothetical protein